MTNNRLQLLRNKMRQEGIDVYYFNTSDYHMSEYVSEYFKTIAYFSGFTGSLATLLVDLEKAYIFVDGRYHVQADKQCLINDVEVIKLGTKDALEPLDFIKKFYKDKVLGLDGKRTSAGFGKKLLDLGINFKSIDIYSDIIENRAPLKNDRIYELDDRYTGLPRNKKLKMIAHYLKDDVHIINNLESIAYLLNLRSNDVLYTPVFMSFLVFYENNYYLFVDKKRLDEELLKKLNEDGVIVKNYDSYYTFLLTIENKHITLDENKVNFESFLLVKNANVIDNKRSIVEDMKAIKNPIEQYNLRLAHIYDGVAEVRFLKWLDEIDKSQISELDAANKIDSLRKEYKANDLSFSSIVAYNENAAQMHYSPFNGHPKRLDNNGILLIDSGGQYNLGTTDITRTVALGEVSDEIKKWFSLVLKSMFNLSEVKFMKGLSGDQLDILARKDLWELGVDYRCGTGHGVGYNLSVHEGPPNVRYMETQSKTEQAEIKPGMVFSDEPGVYFENRFGIRCENLVLCYKDEENEYGEFYKLETLTMVPFDLRLIDKKYLDDRTIRALNKYHQTVYRKLSPYLNDDEKNYLRKITREI